MGQKKMYHVNPKGEVGKCTARPGNCPYGDPKDHMPTPQLARERYEEMMSQQLFKAAKSKLTDRLLASNNGRFPEEIVNQLGGLLESKPFVSMEIIPAGSALYNTALPGATVHDYDFTVFAEPHQVLARKDKKYLQGELDVNVVPITKLDKATRRSTSLSEAFYAYRSNEQLLSSASSSLWQPYLRSIRLPLVRYYDLLDDVKRAHSQSFVEPVSRDDKDGFRNFKHAVRWTLYQKRWSAGGPPEESFNPRLSDGEREIFLRAIESGKLETVFEE